MFTSAVVGSINADSSSFSILTVIRIFISITLLLSCYLDFSPCILSPPSIAHPCSCLQAPSLFSQLHRSGKSGSIPGRERITEKTLGEKIEIRPDRQGRASSSKLHKRAILSCPWTHFQGWKSYVVPSTRHQ